MSSLPNDMRLEVVKLREGFAYAIRLPDELAKRIQMGRVEEMSLQLDSTTSNNRLHCNGASFELAIGKEAQPVDLCRYRKGRGMSPVEIMGTVAGKISIRQELLHSKMAEIRRQTEDAEKARHARRTVALESQPKTMRKRTSAVPAQRQRASKRTLMEQRHERDQALVGPLKTTLTHAPPPQATSPPVAIAGPAMSERDSQTSWSPLLAEHAQPDWPKHTKIETTKMAERKSNLARTTLLPLTTHHHNQHHSSTSLGHANARRATYHQLEGEFGRQYHQSVLLNEWMDRRLAIFRQLEDELAALTSSSREQAPDPQQEEQLSFRVVIEQRRLQDDDEYRRKLEQLEECCATLMVIKARMAELAKSTTLGAGASEDGRSA